MEKNQITRVGSIVARLVPEPAKKARTGKEFAEMWAKRPRLTSGEAN